MRQVLVPGTRKALPHPWVISLQVARGEIENRPAVVEEEYDRLKRRVSFKMSRTKPRVRRYGSGGTPYRSPGRVERLRKNGRLRKDLR